MKKNKPKLLYYSKNDVTNFNKKLIYKGFFSLYEYNFQFKKFNDEFSEKITREVLERKNAVAILAYDVKNDCVILIEQIRIANYDLMDTPWTLEVIAGIMDDSNESIEDTAKREALEEAGIELSNIKKILSFSPSPGGMKELIHLVIGTIQNNFTEGIYGLESENEDIKAHSIKREDALNMIDKGIINNATTIIALQWLQLNYKNLQ